MSEGDQRDNLTHVVLAAQKLAQRMGGKFIPDASIAAEIEKGVYKQRSEALPLSR